MKIYEIAVFSTLSLEGRIPSDPFQTLFGSEEVDNKESWFVVHKEFALAFGPSTTMLSK